LRSSLSESTYVWYTPSALDIMLAAWKMGTPCRSVKVVITRDGAH
jgi:hypothetical protein